MSLKKPHGGSRTGFGARASGRVYPEALFFLFKSVPAGEQNLAVPGCSADGLQPHRVPLSDRVGNATQRRPCGAKEEGDSKDRLW